ncbi:MAG: hypothetical protein C4293_06540 [Nitrospiraceae bacterium]
MIYEAYAATLVGVVSAGVAIRALTVSRNLAPLHYTVVNLIAILLMIVLVTVGYDTILFTARHPHIIISRLVYIGVSWLIFVKTLVVYSCLNPSGLPKW